MWLCRHRLCGTCTSSGAARWFRLIQLLGQFFSTKKFKLGAHNYTSFSPETPENQGYLKYFKTKGIYAAAAAEDPLGMNLYSGARPVGLKNPSTIGVYPVIWSLSVCRPPQGPVPFLCGRGPAAVGGTRCTQGPWGGARVHAPSGTAIAGPRQYPSGSGTSGPGRAGWLPGGKQCRWCSKETRPRRSHVPLLPGEDGKKSGSKEA